MLNLVSGLMYATAAPGTEFSTLLLGPDVENIDAYKQRFNATAFLNSTSPSIAIFFPYVGPLLGAIDSAWTAVKFTVLGFPTMLAGVGNQITDPEAKAAFTTVSNVLYVIFSAIMVFWLFQVVTGRETEE